MNPVADKLAKVILMLDAILAIYEDPEIDGTTRDIEVYKLLKQLREEFV